MTRPPFWERYTPGQLFVLYVSWCALFIVGGLATLLFFPWSLPFAIIAFVVGGYVVARILVADTDG